MQNAITKETKKEDDGYWRVTGSKERYSDEDVYKYVKDKMINASRLDVELDIGVGTDSQFLGKIFKFTSVLCVYTPGKGGFYFYRNERVPVQKYKLSNQKMRMFDEVSKSIELSVKLQDATGAVPTVHVDASPANEKEFTSAFSDQLKGYVQACGFQCALKPDSYVASRLADKHTKKIGSGRRRGRR